MATVGLFLGTEHRVRGYEIGGIEDAAWDFVRHVVWAAMVASLNRWRGS